MNYRRLGKTGLMVSEIGFGAEWVTPTTPAEQARELCDRAREAGVNILDCWMSDPAVRSKLGEGIAGHRDAWYIQGHIGSTWDGSQYVRTRELGLVKQGFEDLLERLGTDYVDLGMIHYVDDPAEWKAIAAGSPYLDYVHGLRDAGTVRHVGLSTHNPEVAVLAARSGEVEMVMFSVNPAFDLLPATPDIDVLFGQEAYERDGLGGMDPVRANMYAELERLDVGITCMKPFAGGRLLSAADSPFGVALSATQCIHYCLTRPAVASVMGGYANVAQLEDALAYEDATADERDYASVLAGAPRNAFAGRCTYCGHCAPCTVGIPIAMVNKFYDLAVQQPEVPASVRGHYEALPVRADACIACAACEPRCPFGVPIAERMSLAAELF
jgi:hypothetical protein